MGEDPYALGRRELLPAAHTPSKTDMKIAEVVMNMTAVRLKLDEVPQCMVFVRMLWTSLGNMR